MIDILLCTVSIVIGVFSYIFGYNSGKSAAYSHMLVVVRSHTDLLRDLHKHIVDSDVFVPLSEDES